MKISLAFYSASGCSGCLLSFLDMEEFFLKANEFSIVWSPMFKDSRFEDLEKVDRIDVTFVEGCVRREEDERVVKVLREKSEKLVALGTCAVFGGVPGLSNFYSAEEIVRDIYGEENRPKSRHILDGKYELTLPEIRDHVSPLKDVVEVDQYIPGCPPSKDQLLKALENSNEEWITSSNSVCTVCPRKPEEFSLSKIRRLEDDDGECFLNQGYLCFGSVTSGNCDAACIKVNVPCLGCFGPFANAIDFGAKFVDLLASIAEKLEVVEELSRKYPNLARLLYIYTLPSATINRKVRRHGERL